MWLPTSTLNFRNLYLFRVSQTNTPTTLINPDQTSRVLSQYPHSVKEGRGRSKHCSCATHLVPIRSSLLRLLPFFREIYSCTQVRPNVASASQSLSSQGSTQLRDYGTRKEGTYICRREKMMISVRSCTTSIQGITTVIQDGLFAPMGFVARSF